MELTIEETIEQLNDKIADLVAQIGALQFEISDLRMARGRDIKIIQKQMDDHERLFAGYQKLLKIYEKHLQELESCT